MSAERPVVRVAGAIDDNYAPHFATLAASLAETRGPELIEITLLAGPEISDATIAELDRFITGLDMKLNAIRIPAATLARLPPANYGLVIWYRIFLPELMPDVDRVLYLDADTIVLQSLAPLYDEDLGGHVLGAIAQPRSRHVVAHTKRIGMDPDEGYFNSGVLLMDLGGMREIGFTERILATTSNGVQVTFPDQDALNFACRDSGGWHRLHPKWNAMSYLWLSGDSIEDARTSDAARDLQRLVALHAPGIVHFEGPQLVKPWYFRSRHPLQEIYRGLRQQTPWPMTELQGRSLVAAMLRILPVHWQYAVARWKAAAVNFLRR